MRGVLILLVAIATFGCGDDEGSILVDLKTDYVSGEEFVTVRTSLFTALPSAGEAPLATRETPASFGQDYLVGVRVAELSLVGSGTAVLRTELLGLDGTIAAERLSRIEVSGSNTGVTVLISRDCVGVVCPGGGPSSSTECFGGLCVTPDCVEESATSCGATECANDAECTAAVACAEGRCVAGACLSEPVSSRCAAGEYCDPEMGCRVRTIPDASMDAAADAGDASLDTQGPDAPDAPDATTSTVCPGVDPNAVALYLLDGLVGGGLADEVGANPGRTVGGSLMFTPGPDPSCGNALTFGVFNADYAVVDDSTDWDIASGSIDFWLTVDVGVGGPPSLGILSRAALGSGMDGTLEVGVSAGRRFVHLLQSGESVLCTDAAIDDSDWHHVGINFGTPGTELWIDNVLQSGGGTVDVSFAPGTLTCGTVDPGAAISGNDFPWVIGASNKASTAGTTDNVEGFLETSAIDHLRISSARRDFSAGPSLP